MTPVARDPVPPSRLQEINPHPGWDDGRRGFLWARFDALLTQDARHLRAEVTWDDDSEFEDNASGEPRIYFDPQLWIETNRRTPDDDLQTVAGFKVELSHTEAVAIVTADPAELLDKYADRIAQLKTVASHEK